MFPTVKIPRTCVLWYYKLYLRISRQPSRFLFTRRARQRYYIVVRIRAMTISSSRIAAHPPLCHSQCDFVSLKWNLDERNYTSACSFSYYRKTSRRIEAILSFVTKGKDFGLKSYRYSFCVRYLPTTYRTYWVCLEGIHIVRTCSIYLHSAKCKNTNTIVD